MREPPPTAVFGSRLAAAARRSLLGMVAAGALVILPAAAVSSPAHRSGDLTATGETAARDPGPAVRYRRALLRLRGLEAVARSAQRQLPAARADRRRAQRALMSRVREIHRNGEPGTLEMLFGSRSLAGVLDLADAFDRIVAQDEMILGTLDRARRRVQALHRKREAVVRRARRELRAVAARVPGLRHSPLAAIAYCESTNDPQAISPDGLYRGKYQFDFATWQTVGGQGDPADAPEAEQDMRARELYQRRGSQPWPVCGQLFEGLPVASAVPLSG